MILRDDFSDPKTDWASSTDSKSEEGYSNGRFRVLIKQDEFGTSDWLEIGGVVEAMRLEVDAVQRTGGPRDEVGVVCYAHVGADKDAGYQLAIRPDGWAGISRVLEGNSTLLEERTEEDAIRPLGATNRVRADCIGARQDEPALIALYVNGQLVARAEDDEGFPRFDGIGVTTWSESGQTEAVYDNVVVRELR